MSGGVTSHDLILDGGSGAGRRVACRLGGQPFRRQGGVAAAPGRVAGCDAVGPGWGAGVVGRGTVLVAVLELAGE